MNSPIRTVPGPLSSVGGEAHLEAILAQLDDPAWPSPQEVADAQHALVQTPRGTQPELPL
jgi:hypothetical protein